MVSVYARRVCESHEILQYQKYHSPVLKHFVVVVIVVLVTNVFQISFANPRFLDKQGTNVKFKIKLQI